MEDVQTFSILFNKDEAIYREGDDIYGKVTVEHGQEVTCKVIELELCGTATVQWSSATTSDKDISNAGAVDKTIDGNKEVYFQKKVVLLEKDAAELLNPVHRNFHFEVKLPPELPSTFEGLYGQMTYHAQLNIDDGSGKSDVVIKKPFTVVSGLDLNFIPEAAAKIELCKYKTIGKCCASGSVTADWTIDRSGFIPGEDIEVHGAVQNDSRDNVQLSKVALCMVVDYKAKKWRRREKREVVAIEKGATQAGEVTVWQDSLHVPPLPPTGLRRCKLIDINYELEFKAILEGNYPPVHFLKPIYIGTVPISPKEMKSCVAGMFNQPYEEHTDHWITSNPSQLSLTQIVSVGGSSVITTEPTAPVMIHPTAPELSSDDNVYVEQNESNTFVRENLDNLADSISKCTEETRLVRNVDRDVAAPPPVTDEALQQSVSSQCEEPLLSSSADPGRNQMTDSLNINLDIASGHLYTYYGTIGKLSN